MVVRILVLLLGLIVVVLCLFGCTSFQRRMLFFPSHSGESRGLTAWLLGGEAIGFSLEVQHPQNVWLLLHGNGGEAGDRAYALHCFSERDSVYILQYPGYGMRKGTPGMKAFNAAAESAYRDLRRRFPGVPVCVAGESIGSGPSCHLGTLESPPDKLVLLVPFERLSAVAGERFPFLPTSLLLTDNWNNVEALSRYRGPVDIFGAAEDRVIPVAHARALADSKAGARFVLLEGGHNEWSCGDKVKIRNP